jgi:hypothetical protein
MRVVVVAADVDQQIGERVARVGSPVPHHGTDAARAHVARASVAATAATASVPAAAARITPASP